MKQSKESKALPSQDILVKKYRFLQEKIIVHYKKGCKILKIAKITAAAVFVLFTLLGVWISAKGGTQLNWLTGWIVLIFVNIIVFTAADYAKYLVGSKVIPYLKDDTRVEFGEYDIFTEESDDDDEEEE